MSAAGFTWSVSVFSIIGQSVGQFQFTFGLVTITLISITITETMATP